MLQCLNTPARDSMFRNIWNCLFGAGRTDIEEHAPKNVPVNEKDISHESTITTPSIQTSVSAPKTPDDEIEVLARYCGGLAKGKVITIGLHEILDIIPRKRRKADAYYALKKQLRDEYSVELIITSRASKKEEPGNGQE